MTLVRVFGFVCGGCLEPRRARVRPDACFACGARFGGADRRPLALAQVEVTHAGEARVSVRTRVDFEGRWSPAERTFAIRHFAAPVEGETQDRSTRTVDGG